MLEEVVVTGYTTQRKADLTGSVAVMDMSKPQSEASANMLSSMQGRLAGVQITTDAAPGGGNSTIRIRGISTVNGSDPLYVIDGIATNENLNSLNPGDIESIQVLKDASSASIYGSRAANGVIIITTKRGKKDRLSVNLGYSASLQTVARTHKMLNAEQWGTVYGQAALNAGIAPTHPFYTFAADGTATLNPSITYTNTNGEAVTLVPTNTVWQNAVYSPAWTHNVNASVAASTEKGNVYFSGNYMKQDGLVNETYYERLSARVNSDFNIGKWVKVGENLMVARWKDNGCGTQDDRGIPSLTLMQHPALPYKDANGNFVSPLQVLKSDYANPVQQLYLGRDNNTVSWRIFGNAFVEVHPGIKELTLKSNIGIEHVQYLSNTYTRKAEPTAVNSFSRGYGQGDTWTWTNTAAYANVWNEVHHFDALFGTEAIGYKFQDVGGTRKGYAFEDVNYMVLNSGSESQTNYGGTSAWGLFSIFAKADYNYADRYLISATVRRDATSRLYIKNNSGWFPSFSAAWRFTAESFFPEQSYFTDGKIRVGWGTNGNAAISNFYSAYSTYTYDIGNSSYDLNGSNSATVTGIKVASTGNKDLKWETTMQTNVGLDLAFFNNSLTTSLDWYLKDTKDMLTVPPVLSVAGENATKFMNTGDMRNWGVEWMVDYRSKNYNGFSWGANFNLSHYKNTVVKLNDYVHSIGGDIRLIEGQAMGVYYGYVNDGIFQNQQQVAEHAIQQGAAPGRLIYRDLNGDGTITDADQCIIGDPNPDLSMGLNLDFKYKGLTVSFFFNSDLGFDIINSTKNLTDFAWNGLATANNRGIRILDAWTPENPNATIPAVSLSNNNNENRMSTYFVEDGSYVKMKYIKVGYDLPNKVLTPWHCQGLNIFAQLENVFTITKYSGLDPELPLGTYGARVDNGSYPRARTFSLGINLAF
ncbi:MAG: TonB-dependent receptor [Paludibacteraceae bacterium]|nr:TonB-dependent receptor [Paludibacteraceae bacterium]